MATTFWARPFEDYANAFCGLGLSMIEPLCSTTLLVAERSSGGRATGRE
jgi:hypothetical protein